jgi:hypothetical protein
VREWTVPWPPGAATGLGPLPGTDAVEAARIVFGELGDLPHLPQLPGRGAGADPVGRTVAMLVGLHADVLAGRWRIVPRSSRDERRARETLERDLDVLEDVGGAHPGPVKIQAVGPWSLAAAVELPRGEKFLADREATRDLIESLVEGLGQHAADVRSRLSRASRVLVQLDEPLLVDVLRGSVASASGWDRLPAPEAGPAEQVLAAALAACGGDGGVWCDVDGAPVAMLRRAGARFLAIGDERLETVVEEELGEAVEAGTGFLVGMVSPGSVGAPPADGAAVVRRVWSRLGLGESHWANVVVTPSADLSDVAPARVVDVLRRCRRTARSLRPEADDDGPPDEGGERDR